MRIHTETLTGRRTFLDEADSFPGLSLKHRWIRSLVGARFLIRRRRYDEASRCSPKFGAIDSTSPGLGVARLVDTAHLPRVDGDPRSIGCGEHCTGRRSAAARSSISTSRRSPGGISVAGRRVSRLPSPQSARGLLGTSPILADLFVRRLERLGRSGHSSDSARDADASSAVGGHALGYELDSSTGPHETGHRDAYWSRSEINSDIRRLRTAGRSLRRVPGASELGRGLARRLAPRVDVEDLGRMTVIGRCRRRFPGRAFAGGARAARSSADPS